MTKALLNREKRAQFDTDEDAENQVKPQPEMKEDQGLLGPYAEKEADYFAVKQELQDIAKHLKQAVSMEHVMLPPDAQAPPQEMSKQTVTFGKGTRLEKKFKITPHDSSHKVMPLIAFSPESDDSPLESVALPSIEERIMGGQKALKVELERRRLEDEPILEEQMTPEVLLQSTNEPISPLSSDQMMLTGSDSDQNIAGPAALISCSGLFFIVICFLVFTIIFEMIKYCKSESPSRFFSDLTSFPSIDLHKKDCDECQEVRSESETNSDQDLKDGIEK